MIKPWEKISSKPLGDFRIFTIRSDRKISPRTQQEHDFFVIDSVNWVNVIALTSDQHLVMVEQYRHGSNTVELEIPGGVGVVGAGHRKHSPFVRAVIEFGFDAVSRTARAPTRFFIEVFCERIAALNHKVRDHSMES